MKACCGVAALHVEEADVDESAEDGQAPDEDELVEFVVAWLTRD